jgi:hypothetical protein
MVSVQRRRLGDGSLAVPPLESQQRRRALAAGVASAQVSSVIAVGRCLSASDRAGD